MRIILITQGINPVFHLLKDLEAHILVGVVEDAPRRTYELSRFQKLIKKIKSEPTLNKLCRSLHLPYTIHSKYSRDSVAKWVENLVPDLIIVYSMSRLLSPDIFNIPKYGAINIHPGILPQYKGRDPWNALYANFDLNPGVTIHFIDSGEDTGDVITQQNFTLQIGTPIERAMDLSVKLACDMLVDVIRNFEDGKIVRISQKDLLIAEVKKSGSIDWNLWETKRVWHYLKGTQIFGLSLVLPQHGLLKFSDWHIGNMHIQSENKLKNDLGKVKKINGKWMVQCRDGEIVLVNSLKVKSIIKRIFEG